jgi:hypothetical protein
MRPKREREEKKRRPFELVFDAVSGEFRGRELPLSNDEKVDAFDAIRVQGVTVDLARRRMEAAAEAMKEATAAHKRELQRLFEMSRHDPQGVLFPVTDAEIREANQRAMKEPPAPKKSSQEIDGKSRGAGERPERDDEADAGEAA